MFIRLTLNYSGEPILINLDMVTAFHKNFNDGGCWVDYVGGDIGYRVTESLDEIQALISARIMNP